MRRHWILLLVAAVALGAAVPALMAGEAAFARLGRIPAGGLALLLGMIFTCWNLNALRLRLMLHERAENLGHGKALGTVMATEFVFNATPGGSGAPFALAGLLRRHGVSGSTATAVFAVDQLTDMVVFLVLLPALLFYGLTRYFHMAGLWQVALPFALLLAGLLLAGLLVRHHRRLVRALGRLMERHRVSGPRRIGWARRFIRFRDGLEQTLTVPKSHLLAMFLLCAAHWLVRYSVIYVTVRALGGHLDWVYGFFVQMVAMGAGHLTLLPGGAGGAEVAAAALLTPWLGASLAATVILVWRFMTFYLYLLAGGAVMLFLAGGEARDWLRGTPS